MRWLGLLLTLAGCTEPAPAGPTPAAREDGRALATLLEDATYARAYAPAEAAVDDDLPVRAADLLRARTLPVVTAQLERLRAFEAESAEGRRVARRGVAALEARREALETYAAALERGLIEDLVLVDALQAMRRAEEAVDAALAAMASLGGGAAVPEDARHDTTAPPTARPAPSR